MRPDGAPELVHDELLRAAAHLGPGVDAEAEHEVPDGRPGALVLQHAALAAVLQRTKHALDAGERRAGERRAVLAGGLCVGERLGDDAQELARLGTHHARRYVRQHHREQVHARAKHGGRHVLMRAQQALERKQVGGRPAVGLAALGERRLDGD